MSVLEKVRATALRYGVDPDFAVSIAWKENRGRSQGVSPKGAVGPMQLMPGTARDLGVDPHDEDQNIDGGVRYLKQQLDAFGGDRRLAAAAYNAGPGAVRRAGGVPNFPETQDYVRSTVREPQSGADIFGMDAPGPQGSGQSGADIFAEPASTPKAKVAPAPAVRPAAPAAIQRVPQMAAQPAKAAPRSTPLDAILGLGSGAQKGGASMADTILGAGPLGLTASTLQNAALIGDLITGKGRPAPVSMRQPAVFSGQAARNGYKPQTNAGKVMETIGTMLPNAAVPGSVPQRILNVIAPAFGQEAAERGAKAVGMDENAQKVAGVVGATLGGAATGLRMGPKAAKLPTADLNALDTAQKAAWAKVNASTYQFPAADAQKAAKDVAGIVREADPDLYPDAAKWAAKVQRMADRGELTLGKLNTLKSQMGEQLLTGKEASVGREMVNRVEQLIGTAKDPSLTAAREAYKRFMKVKDVTARLEDAELARASSGTGGNTNAVRQAVKPLVKKRGAQRMTNATPDEIAAMKQVVNGTPMENAMRVLSAFDPTSGKLGALLTGPMALGTKGLSLLAIPAGMAAKAGERGQQAKSVQAMLDLFAAGGVKPAAPKAPLAPYAGVPALTSALIAAPAAAQPRPRPKARQSK